MGYRRTGPGPRLSSRPSEGRGPCRKDTGTRFSKVTPVGGAGHVSRSRGHMCVTVLGVCPRHHPWSSHQGHQETSFLRREVGRREGPIRGWGPRRRLADDGRQTTERPGVLSGPLRPVHASRGPVGTRGVAPDAPLVRRPGRRPRCTVVRPVLHVHVEGSGPGRVSPQS